ncbi:MAG: F0F1 ATP synthase subunit A [Verrucomicrobia bacterium]|nr:F0F1 ATP synthase subunit A [Verrucomicrobiota bacterium]
MRLTKLIWALILLVGAASFATAAVDPAAAGHEAVAAHAAAAAGEAAHEGGHGHGLPPAASPIFNIGPLVVTNSMLVVWIVAIALVIFAQAATRNMKEVPEGLQNFWEWLVESLYDFLGGVLGPDLVKRSFWFFGTLFILILTTNWMGLIPGVGTLYYKGQPLLRGGNADLNMTAAMSLLFFFFWIIWSVQALGVVGIIKHIFGGQSGGGLMGVFISLIFIVVGLIEVVSILFRPVSLSFRLYGNVFAGENILEAMMGIVPWLAPVIPIPFYFLELLVGLVQALVFTLLTAVFTALMCAHHDDHGHGADKAHAAGPDGHAGHAH